MRFGRVLVNRNRLCEIILCIVKAVGAGAYRAQPQQRPVMSWALCEHEAEQLLRVGEISSLLQLPGHLEGEFGPGFRLGCIQLGRLGLGWFGLAHRGVGDRGLGDRGLGDRGLGAREFAVRGFGSGGLCRSRGKPVRTRALARRPQLAFGRRAFDLQCLQKGREPRAIKTRSPDRARIDRLPDLDQACGVDRTIGLMKGQASLVPIQPAMRDKTPGLARKIADDVLILHFENPSRRQTARQWSINAS